MRRLALSSVLALSASLAMTPLAHAAGFIVIDPIFHPITPPHVVHPIIGHPGHAPNPPGAPVMLHGSVSFGVHLQSEDVHVDINDQVAKTYITQTFMNETDQNLAGTYLFPLPEDTTFSSFSLHIDGKPVEGKILEANEARAQYEAIVRQMVDPGLLEYADYKTVRARIFPIPAHGTKKVEFEYTQVLKAENGLLKYNFPLKSKGESGAIDDLKFNVKLASKQGLRTIWSPSHTITSTRDGDHLAKIAMVSHDTVPDKDFLLYYSVSDKDMAANLLTNKAPDENGYFLMTLTPPVKSTQIAAKDIVLVVDTSGSMQGQKLEQAKKALKYIVNALGASDRFSIVQFNTDVEPYQYHVVPATAENKKTALSFIDDLEARGGTNISGALQMGGSMLADKSDRPGYVVLMTDGEPTVGECDPARLAKAFAPKRDIRLFDFGVGYDVNTRLLNKLADEHHGTSQYVEPDENLETTLSSFYQKIKSPVLSNVHITYSGVEAKDVYPREVKDIFAGNQVLLIGKYKSGGKATVTISGDVNSVAKSYSFPLTFSSEDAGHTYLPRLWAMRRIAHLTDVAQENGNSKEVVDEIVELSKKYGIISQYTSFLVTDPSENHRLPMPIVRRMDAPMPTRAARFDFAPNAWREESRQKGRASVVHGAMLQGATNGSIGAQQFSRSAMSVNSAMGMPQDAVAAPMAPPVSKSLAMSGMAAGGEADFNKSPAPMPSYSSSSPVGLDAVKKAKQNERLKDFSVVADDEKSSAGMRTVADKTFYLRGGIWTESAALDSHHPALETIEFGSKRYFELISAVPGISKYLSVGDQVIFIYKGHGYKILKSGSAATTG